MSKSTTKELLSVSPKGTITIPIEIRRAMGIEPGERETLVIKFDFQTKQAVLIREMSLDQLQAKLSKYARGKPPLKDVGGFYKTTRLTKKNRLED